MEHARAAHSCSNRISRADKTSRTGPRHRRASAKVAEILSVRSRLRYSRRWHMIVGCTVGSRIAIAAIAMTFVLVDHPGSRASLSTTPADLPRSPQLVAVKGSEPKPAPKSSH